MRSVATRPRVLASGLATLLVPLALSFDAHAYSVSIPTAELAPGRMAVAASYGQPLALSRWTYPGPASEPVAVGAVSASTGTHEIEAWQLMLAIMGLVGVRMWRTGKKSLPLLG